MDKGGELAILILSWQNMYDRGCLSDTGKEYLDGLKRAHEIIFPLEDVA